MQIKSQAAQTRPQLFDTKHKALNLKIITR